jgi:thioester reductase-like protein
MSTGKGTISSNDLMTKLVMAKKVMDKVDNGNYERGHVNEDIIKSSPDELSQQNLQSNPVRPANNGIVDFEKIQNSKLPDNIKKAMMENPIPQISLNETIDMDFVKGAKRLMEQEGVSTKKTTTQTNNGKVTNPNFDMNAISVLIENTVRKVLDEKLNQILTAQQTQSINENLVLKVGDSIFKGKITGVNKAKK